MARPLRLELSGALYHFTARGGRKEGLYEDDEDRDALLDVLAGVVDRLSWLVHAYRRHGRTGHLFQGRYKVILVQKDSYSLEVARYVVLNPFVHGSCAVRATGLEQHRATAWRSDKLAYCGRPCATARI